MKFINLIFLSIFLIIFSPLFSMDELTRQLIDLQRSLDDLSVQLNALQQSVASTEIKWNINTDTAPHLITQIVNAIDGWLAGQIKSFPIEEMKGALLKNINSELSKHERELQSVVVPSNERALSEFKAVLKQILEDYFTALHTADFNWCTCIREGKRIALIIEVLQEVKEKRPDKTKKLVYTSLGAGGLMQDYLMLRALLRAGYKNIEANIIDLIYPDVPLLSKQEQEQLAILEKEERKEPLTEIEREILKNLPEKHDIFLLDKKRNVYRIQNFSDLLKGYATEQNAHIDITVYNQIYKYVEKITEPQDLEKYIAMLERTKSSLDDQVKIQALEKQIVHLKEVLANRKKVTQLERTDILLMVDPGVGFSQSAIPNYPSLATAFNITIADRKGPPAFYLFVPRHQGVQLYEEIVQDNLPQVIRLKQQLIDLITSFSAQDSYSSGFVTTLFERYGNAIRFFAEPYSEFQNLVWQTLAPNPIVYTLVQENLVDYLFRGSPDTSKIRKINVATYKEADVITPHAGKYLQEAGKRMPPRNKFEYERVRL